MIKESYSSVRQYTSYNYLETNLVIPRKPNKHLVLFYLKVLKKVTADSLVLVFFVKNWNGRNTSAIYGWIDELTYKCFAIYDFTSFSYFWYVLNPTQVRRMYGMFKWLSWYDSRAPKPSSSKKCRNTSAIYGRNDELTYDFMSFSYFWYFLNPPQKRGMCWMFKWLTSTNLVWF